MAAVAKFFLMFPQETLLFRFVFLWEKVRIECFAMHKHALLEVQLVS